MNGGLYVTTLTEVSAVALRHPDVYVAAVTQNPKTNRQTVEHTEIVVLWAIPRLVPEVLQDIAPVMSPDVLIISVAAEVSVEHIQALVPDSTCLIRVLPNMGGQVSLVSSGLVEQSLCAMISSMRSTDCPALGRSTSPSCLSMRPSKKTQILEAAVELIEPDNLEAVSYEALVVASDMSKSGSVYHFPSRYEIIRGIHQYLADQWEDELDRAAGGPAHEVDATTRLRAVVISQSNAASKAELLLESDVCSSPEFSAIWSEVNDRWVPSTDGIEDDDELRSRYLVKLLAEGLWMHDYVQEEALPPRNEKP